MIDPDSFETNKTPERPKRKTEASKTTATGFLSHLIELRDRLLRIVIVLVVLFAVLYPFNEQIFNWLAASLVEQNYTLININPIEAALVPMKLVLLVAFLLTSPYILYQFWAFISPGLYKHEKRLVYPLLISSIFLFFLGIIFVYYLILPMVFIVLPKFLPALAVFQPDIGFFLSFTTVMFFAFGFGFEIPIITILLISTGMTTAEKLKEKRPYVIVGAFVAGMLLTPPDVVSQIMLAIPMWLLFELGIIFSKYFKVRIKEASEARNTMNEDNLTEAEKKTAAVTGALQADKLWEDDTHVYEEGDGLSDEERSILNKDPLDEDVNDEEYLPEDEDEDEDENENENENEDEGEEKFFDNVDYDEPTEEEMEAELDRIEAQEEADKAIEKKTKKRAKTKKKIRKNKDKKK